jgi:membrane associated rhomboid family serine protease
MDQLANSLSLIVTTGINNLPLVLILIGSLWVIQLVNAGTHYFFNRFGILPRSKRGIIGIVLCPLLHGSFEHLFLNSLFLFILISLVLTYGLSIFIYSTLIIILGGGLLVWLFGRPALHIGASGLAMGYWGFLLLASYAQGGFVAILLGVMCVYFFGGLFFNLFPKDKRTSWEGHLGGFLAGIVAAFLLFHI